MPAPSQAAARSGEAAAAADEETPEGEGVVVVVVDRVEEAAAVEDEGGEDDLGHSVKKPGACAHLEAMLRYLVFPVLERSGGDRTCRI